MADSIGPKTIILYIAMALLSALYLYAGFQKVSRADESVALFTRYGLPIAFMLFIGICEIAGAVGLWIPRLSILAATGLIALMLGAIAMHFMHDPIVSAMPATISIVLLVLVILLRRSLAANVTRFSN